MMQKFKKILRYLKKMIQMGKPLEIFQIIKYVKLKHLLIALAARLDRRPACVEMRKDSRLQEINIFIELIKYKKSLLTDDLCLWDCKGKLLCGNYLQFEGLYFEYLSGIFNEHYLFEWKDKHVLDVGGFVGDSALFFLENGAKKVIVYEPLAKNLTALSYNLKAYQPHVEVYPCAIAKESGTFTISSNLPEGMLGFGQEKGAYKIQCEGVTFTELLEKHCVDVIKVDCEGAEEHLLTTQNSLICLIPYWIIETHSPELYKSILKKFEECGFSMFKDITLNAEVNLLHFALDSV